MTKTFFFLQDFNAQQERPADTLIKAGTEKTESSPQANVIIADSGQITSPADTFYNKKASTGFTFSDNDSITTVENLTPAKNTPDLFRGHALQPSLTNPVPLKKMTPDWFTIALFITIAFFTWLKIINGKIIQQLFAAFVNNSVTNQIVRDENILVQKASVMLSLVFYFTAALLLYEVSVYFNWEYRIIGKGIVRFIIFVLFIASAYSFKMVFLKMMSMVFKMDRAFSTYIFNIFLINNIIGIMLIPLLVLIAFFPEATSVFIWAGIGMLLAGYLYRIFRGLIIWTSLSRFSLYYLILYLCALEIAPLLILFKIA